MPYCPHCGSQVDSSATFCSSCGGKLPETPSTPVPPTSATERELNISSLIWAIVTTIFFFLPLGILAIVFTVLAKDSPTDEEEAKNLRYAKNCNLAGTLIFAVLFVIGIVGTILSAISALALGAGLLGFLG